MKFSKIEAFVKHLTEALPEHPSPLYYIFIPDPFEREYLAKRLIASLQVSYLRLTDATFKEHFNAPSFLDEGKAILCDELTLESLPKMREKILILTGSQPLPSFKSHEKEAVSLDLSGEKPWDRKSRLQQWLIAYAKKEGKGTEKWWRTRVIKCI